MRNQLRAWAMYISLYARLGTSLPWRLREKSRLAQKFGFGTFGLEPRRLAAVLRVKNEDFWIELILRTVCKELDEVIVIDSGSQDKTLEIVRALQSEGLRIQLIAHHESPVHFNLIVNLVLAQVLRAEYYCLVDGDELQFQASLAQCKQALVALDTEKYWRIAMHHLFVHPENVLLCSRPFSPHVRFAAGRIFNRRKLVMSETMINDGIQRTNGMPFLTQQQHSLFLEDAFALHCPSSQRSTISDWRGNAEINPSYAWTYRQARYKAPETDYTRLPFFPKEIHECKYSTHNHYLAPVLAAQIPLQ